MVAAGLFMGSCCSDTACDNLLAGLPTFLKEAAVRARGDVVLFSMITFSVWFADENCWAVVGRRELKLLLLLEPSNTRFVKVTVCGAIQFMVRLNVFWFGSMSGR